jgi:hypothetical protein
MATYMKLKEKVQVIPGMERCVNICYLFWMWGIRILF